MGHRTLHLGHARGAADHDDPLDFGGGEPRVAQHAADHGQAAGGERRSGRVKIRKFDVKMNASA